MLYKEKYVDELLDFAIHGNNIAVNKNTLQPCDCTEIGCDECLGSNSVCDATLKEWFNSECVEQIELSEDEKVILKNIDKKYNWIARDECGDIYLYHIKPYKKNSTISWDYDYDEAGDCSKTICFTNLFKFIKWEDKEPYEIKELLK